MERLDRGDYRLVRREAPPNEGAIDIRSSHGVRTLRELDSRAV